ncbi:MAG TPA: phosphate regulon sensor histidine kinase PhoR [Sedimenticola thiotaurini]|uniref:Phosphate regulon sensor protein PhoR n=1 Tax=Sedimenticola thiotaurini TaxID=1543721 RepID=A0A831W3H9_9GAMM|nr:phosphate regulon sensor histidine kinase PhoR [Sedimenticola thiotaurini]
MRTRDAWRRELLLLAAAAVLLFAVGLLSGRPLLFLLIGSIVLLARHLYRLWRVTRWLEQPKHHPAPGASGVWQPLIREIRTLRARGRKRKRKLSRMLAGFQESTGALPDATVVLDDQGRVEWWNRAARGLLGLERKRSRGRRIDTVIGDPVFRDYLASTDYDRPLKIPSPMDPSVSLEVRIVPYGKGKRLLQARDITRLQQLETVRRDFVANVSHEIRTPLTVIRGYLETMEQAGDADLARWEPAIGQMLQQSRRMQQIVEDLLLLSRVESGDEAAVQEEVDVPAMLQRLVTAARELSGGRHRIEPVLDGRLRLHGNAAELESAFSNLVFNAIRYTPDGGNIRLRWWLGEEGGPCFEVRDDGIGIDPEHLPRLTERFYRVDVGRSRSSGGTGLGLAIVKHVVSRHQGNLRIESEPGRGSTFTCCFPGQRMC